MRRFRKFPPFSCAKNSLWVVYLQSVKFPQIDDWSQFWQIWHFVGPQLLNYSSQRKKEAIFGNRLIEIFHLSYINSNTMKILQFKKRWGVKNHFSGPKFYKYYSNQNKHRIRLRGFGKVIKVLFPKHPISHCTFKATSSYFFSFFYVLKKNA